MGAARVKFLLGFLVPFQAFVLSPLPITAQEEKKPRVSDLELSRLMTGWEKEEYSRLSKNEKLKALAAKHSLALIHCCRKYADPRSYRRSAYSFAHESSVEAVHCNLVHIRFYGDLPRPFIGLEGEHPVLVRLQKTDFDKNIDPRKIGIDDPGILTSQAMIQEGEVYLLRVRDWSGNDFFVVFQVITIDTKGRYMSFLWRPLPHGRPIVRIRPVLPEN